MIKQMYLCILLIARTKSTMQADTSINVVEKKT